MIDELIDCDEAGACTTFTVRRDNLLVENGELSEAGLVENIAQTSAAGVGYLMRQKAEPALTGYIAAIKDLEIFALPVVGDLIETVVTIGQQIFDVMVIHGSVKSNGILMAECEMKIFIKR